jgi:hypothetical protein
VSVCVGVCWGVPLPGVTHDPSRVVVALAHEFDGGALADQAVHVHPQHGLDRDVPHFVEGGVVLVVVDAEKELADGGKLPAPVPQMNLLGSVRVLLVPPLHLQRSKNEEARTKEERTSR